MSNEDEIEQLPPNKSLVVYFENAIVPPDVIKRLRDDSFVIQARISKLFGDVQNKKTIAGGAVAATFVVMTVGINIYVGIILAAIAFACAYSFLFPEKRENFEKDMLKEVLRISNTPFHCPHCSVAFNAADEWRCGNCSNNHLQEKEQNFKYTSPFIECTSRSCSAPRQIGIQCPNPRCSRHIILDTQRYAQNQSYSRPYLGVARFGGDNNQPQVPENFDEVEYTSSILR